MVLLGGRRDKSCQHGVLSRQVMRGSGFPPLYLSSSTARFCLSGEILSAMGRGVLVVLVWRQEGKVS